MVSWVSVTYSDCHLSLFILVSACVANNITLVSHISSYGIYTMYVGIFIVGDQFSIGESATASCKSDAPATMIEWLRDGMVVESAAFPFTGIQTLDLIFSPVNDSIHTEMYMCRVTRDGGNGMTVTAVKNFTVNVDGKMLVLSVRAYRSE